MAKAAELHSILIVKTSSLGDIVCSLPVLSELRRLNPRAYIGWVVDVRFADILAADQRLDRVYTFDRHKRGRRRGLREAAAFLREIKRLGAELRQRQWDAAVDLQNLFKSSLILRASRARLRVAEFQRLRHFFSLWAANKIVRPTQRHAVRRYLEIAAPLGVTGERVEFGLRPSDRARQWAERTLAALPRPRVAVNVGTARPEKLWPPGRFVETLKLTAQRADFSVVVTGAPSERQRAEQVANGSPCPTLNLAGETNLQQLVAALEACDVLLTADSGPMHVMAALGKPVVAVFGPTDPEENGPWGDQHQVVRSPTRRMEDIEPQRVAEALGLILDRIAR